MSAAPAPVVSLQSLGIDAQAPRVQEALLAHVLGGWSFWRDDTAAILRPPAGDWIRTNFDPRSIKIDLGTADTISPYHDWDRGGSLWKGQEGLSDGVPHWSRGHLLDMLVDLLVVGGFSLSIAADPSGVVAVVKWDESQAQAIAKSSPPAIVKAAAMAVVARFPNRRFPLLHSPK